ncbi:uncharacterized protein (DUF849 family) [Bradyrhizobium sp. USDA 4451]
MSDKAVITCALNGVLTDPKQHNVPVTPEEMAREAKAAFNAGASIMHIHLRQQAPNKGHLPSWEVAVSKEIQQAIREACPGVIINHTTGTSGPNYQGALDCVRETRPEIAACNAGSLNYLKVKADNTWAWPPMMFDNAVEKVQDYLDVMKARRHHSRIRMLRCRHRALRRHVPADRDVFRAARIQFRDGRRLGNAGRS